MLRMSDEMGMVVGVLHAIIEDTPWTSADLAAEGIPPEVVWVIQLLSRNEGESSEDFIARLAPDPLARRAKIADLEDYMDVRRLKSISEGDWERIALYQQARQDLIEWKTD